MAKIGGDSRFRSLQLCVSQESFGESIQRNMSWAGYDRPLPPEMLPNRLFDRVFGAREEGWVNRKRSILDTVREDTVGLKKELPADDYLRVEEQLSAIRDVERAITGLPPQYRKVDLPDYDGDMKDWPRIAKLQSDLLAHGHQADPRRFLHAHQGPGAVRFSVAGFDGARHHDYAHADGKAPGGDGADGQRILRDICRWNVEEFACLIAKLKATPEGDGNVLDRSCVRFVHEHAEPIHTKRAVWR
jgi:hypothetical protein